MKRLGARSSAGDDGMKIGGVFAAEYEDVLIGVAVFVASGDVQGGVLQFNANDLVGRHLFADTGDVAFIVGTHFSGMNEGGFGRGQSEREPCLFMELRFPSPVKVTELGNLSLRDNRDEKQEDGTTLHAKA